MPYDFTQYLIIFLILLLFGKEYIPALLNKFGIKIGTDKQTSEIQRLSSYYNHDLTDHLQNINTALQSILAEEKNESEERREVLRLLNEMYRKIK